MNKQKVNKRGKVIVYLIALLILLIILASVIFVAIDRNQLGFGVASTEIGTEVSDTESADDTIFDKTFPVKGSTKAIPTTDGTKEVFKSDALILVSNISNIDKCNFLTEYIKPDSSQDNIKYMATVNLELLDKDNKLINDPGSGDIYIRLPGTRPDGDVTNFVAYLDGKELKTDTSVTYHFSDSTKKSHHLVPGDSNHDGEIDDVTVHFNTPDLSKEVVIKDVDPK